MSEHTVQEIEVSMEQNEKVIALRDALSDLTRDKRWERLINDEYLKEEPARLVLLKASPMIDSEEKRRDIENQLNAIGYFYQFLHSVMKRGELADKAKADMQSELELALDETGEAS